MKKILTTAYTDTGFNIALLLLRGVFGFTMFINHGVPKLMQYSSRSQSFYDPFGIGSEWSLILVLFAELFCSILLLLGLFTRLALIPLLITMGVILFMLNKGKAFSESEMALIYGVVYMVIMIVGPGKYSVDAEMGH